MMYVTTTKPDGTQHTTLTTSFRMANAAYWQAASFGEPGTKVEAHGFIPTRTSTFKCFSFGNKERKMHDKHNTVIPKNARLVRA